MLDEPQARPRSRREKLRLGYYGEILGAKNGRSEVIKKWRQPMGRGEILRVEGLESFFERNVSDIFQGGGETLTPLLLGYRRLLVILSSRRKQGPLFSLFYCTALDEYISPERAKRWGRVEGSMLDVTFKLQFSLVVLSCSRTPLSHARSQRLLQILVTMYRSSLSTAATPW